MKNKMAFLLLLFVLSCEKEKDEGVSLLFTDTVSSLEQRVLSCKKRGSIIYEYGAKEELVKKYIQNDLTKKSYVLNLKNKEYKYTRQNSFNTKFRYFGFKELEKNIKCYNTTCSEYLFWDQEKVQYIITSTKRIPYHKLLLKKQNDSEKNKDMLLGYFKNKVPEEVIVGMKILKDDNITLDNKLTSFKEVNCRKEDFEVPVGFKEVFEDKVKNKEIDLPKKIKAKLPQG